MKKTILWGALFTLICTQVQAEVTQQPTQSQTPGSTNTPVTNVQTNQVPEVKQGTPIIEPTQVQPTQTLPANQQPVQNIQNPQPTQVQPANQQPVQNIQSTQPTQVQPANQQPVQNIQSTQPTQVPVEKIPSIQAQPAPVINCEYKIPAQTKTIEQSLVLTWSEKAATQVFDFDPANVDSQVEKLKACFTDQGWVGFNSALEKSGNLEAIKTQKLTVSSQIDGQTQITAAKDNQWKLTLPLHVVYQNDKEKVTQLLNVNLTIGRKISGNLGIIQMIATPRTATTTNTPATPGSTGTPPVDQLKPSTDSTTTNNPGVPH